MSIPHLVVILASLAAAAVLLFILMAAGARLRSLLRVPLPADLKAPCDFLTGCWMYGMLALVAGLAGLFRAPVLLGLAAVLAAVGRWQRPGWGLRSLLPPLLACLVLIPIALAWPFFYDALVYHLALPWQWLVEGRIAAHGEDLFSSFPPLTQLVYAAPMAVGFDRAAALLHLVTFVLGGAAIAGLARRLGASRGWARCAGALLPLLPAAIIVPGVPAAEGFAVAGAVASLTIALGGATRSSRSRSGAEAVTAGGLIGKRRRAALAASAAAGVFAGIATAARLQGLSWTIILLIVLLVGPPLPVRRLLAAGSGWLVGSAPWWLKNLILLRDPFAPIGWQRPGIETLWRDSRGLMHRTTGAGDVALALWNAVQPHLAYAGPLILAALFAFVVTRRRRAGRSTGIILLAAGLGTAAWCLTGSLPRFWTPSLALLLALAAAATITTTGRWAGGLAIVATAVLGIIFTAREVGKLGGLRLLLPGDGAARSLIVNDPHPAFAAAAALPPGVLPSDARVLFIAEARSYRFPRRSIVPSQHDISPLRDLIETSGSATAVRDALLARGITHLLVNRAEMARLARDYPVLPWETPAGQERFQALLGLCGAPIAKAGETAIFALR